MLCMTIVTRWAFVLTAGCAVMSGAARKEGATVTDLGTRVVDILDREEFKVAERMELRHLGESAFPTYHSVLSDENSHPLAVARTLGVLREVPGNRRQFARPAVERLDSSDAYVRIAAAIFLAENGNDDEAAAVAALLDDQVSEVAINAARVLDDRGDRSSFARMRSWLQAHGSTAPPGVRAEVERRLAKDN